MPHQQDPPMPDRFVPSQAGTDSTNFFGGNSQNNEGTLESMIRKPSSSGGFYGTPFLPNQLQSTGWPGASNYFSPTPNTSNFTSGNPGSSAIPLEHIFWIGAGKIRKTMGEIFIR
uniref:Ovule protein n=1 Tax=Globodera pallida TaxID=36090 RepID=A0A183BZ18_GLOPA